MVGLGHIIETRRENELRRARRKTAGQLAAEKRDQWKRAPRMMKGEEG